MNPQIFPNKLSKKDRFCKACRSLLAGFICLFVACSNPKEELAKPEFEAIPEAIPKAIPEPIPKVVEEKMVAPIASDEEPMEAPRTLSELPEMRIPERTLLVKELFVEAYRHLRNKHFEDAIQIIQKLNDIELSDREKMALDLFLSEIEKAITQESELAKMKAEE